MPAERRGKPKNRNGFLNRKGLGIVLWTLNFRMKEREYAAVSERKVSITIQRRERLTDEGAAA
jgi:hypothetical protein